MGFRRSETLDIKFPSGHELHGLEVAMNRLSVGQMIEIGKLADASDDDRRATEDLMRRIAENLASWNLEDGQGVPVDLPGGPLEVEVERDGEKVLVPAGNYAVVLGRDMPLIMQIQKAWMDVAVDVPAPLSRPSSNGAPLEVPPIPMEVLSPNLTS